MILYYTVFFAPAAGLSYSTIQRFNTIPERHFAPLYYTTLILFDTQPYYLLTFLF
jgi:hypothetical protein